ncbi:MAG TPA: STAS domain-containing protein [Tepidisphaeraceae bacterium]|nr:STAS domain-containing protein [Tepidisphaeraceae bacterium]
MGIETWSESVVVAHLGDDPQFSDDVAAVEASDPLPHAVLDFAAVGYLNSSNLAALLRLRKLALNADRRLVLCNLNPAVWGVFLTTGLDNVFQCSSDVTTALATIQIG